MKTITLNFEVNDTVNEDDFIEKIRCVLLENQDAEDFIYSDEYAIMDITLINQKGG